MIPPVALTPRVPGLVPLHVPACSIYSAPSVPMFRVARNMGPLGIPFTPPWLLDPPRILPIGEGWG